MIGYLKGSLIESAGGRMLVGLGYGESTVGYQVAVPARPEYELARPGTGVELFIHTHVREDALDLYGFASRAERELFLSFLSVTGIGPKLALGLLSGAQPDRLIEAVISRDLDFLTAIPGIGRKTAERIGLELSESLRKKLEAGQLGRSAALVAQAGASPRTAGGAEARGGATLRDAREALVSLGFREQEVGPLLERVLADAGPEARAEELVKRALRRLG
jgi:holliday junction DNA helicase RuvA